MQFSVLADYFEQLDGTASRLELIRILSELFKKVSASEVDKTVYLIQGRVVPFFDPTEIGMADKMVIKALATAYDHDPAEIVKLNSQLGDLGLVAERLSEKRKAKSEKLTVGSVHAVLYEIATTGGDGSVDKKVTLLADLLKEMNPKGAKYLLRITLAKLRLGVGDPTVMEALSLAKAGDKTARPALEEAYNKTSDLGLIAKTYWESGLKAIEKIKLQVGKPVRPALAERAANFSEVVKRMGESFAVEPKYDGFRCITGHTPLYIRGRGLISAREIKVGEEILTHNGEFKKIIATRKRELDKGEKLFKLQSYLGNEIKITEKHPILVSREGKEKWINVEEINPKTDWFIFPIPQLKSLFKVPNPHLTLVNSSGYSKTINTDQDFYKFLGFWIGDGFTNEFHNTQRVGLTFNANTEEDLAAEYKKIVQEKFLIPKISESTQNGGLNLYWRDEPFKDWLGKYFRREWKGKMVPEWFVNISKENFKAFLKGWIESDGTPRHNGGFRITTKEADLASLVQLIGLKLGIALGLRKIRVKGSTYFEVIVPGTNRYISFEKNKINIKILHFEELKDRDPRTVVYNFQVEGDESYCSSLVTFHNCQIHLNRKNKAMPVQIFSRNLENMTPMFPDILEAASKEVKADTAIFEGEALAYNQATEEFLPFQETTKRRRKYDISEFALKLPLKCFAFDLLYINGEDITTAPYTQRREKLQKMLVHPAQRGKPENIMVAKEVILHTPQDLEKMFNEQIALGLEGVMVKKLDATYKAGGRGFHWIKVKRTAAGELSDTVDCVLLGVYTGTGKRTEFGVGGLLVGLYDDKKDEFVTVTRIGTGLTDEEFRKVNTIAQKLKVKHKPARVSSLIEPDIWVEPKEVIEVFADEITKSPRHTAGMNGGETGYALRFPRLVSFRGADKRAEDATTVKELIKMYESQRKVKIT